MQLTDVASTSCIACPRVCSLFAGESPEPPSGRNAPNYALVNPLGPASISAFLMFVFLFIAVSSVPAHAQFGKILDSITKPKDPSGGASGLTEQKAASGIKEALRVGAENAVSLTGRTDGYFKNEAIKILLPDKLKMAEKGLRIAGMGRPVDDFVLSMNRAAETAAPFAKNIFRDAILQMTLDDARKLVTGGDTSATDFFRDKTGDKLREAFRPPVEKAMADNGVLQAYQRVTGGLGSLPFGKTETLDISSYVVGKSLDGLFYMLAQEEKKIRKDPVAQTTSLLKEVFGGKKQ